MKEMTSNNVLPPVTNRGVENTSQTRLTSLVDWLQVTLFDVTDKEQVVQILSMKDAQFTNSDSGKYGYAKSYRSKHIAIYYGGMENMGIHLEMSGQGCREYELLTTYENPFPQLLQLLFLANCKITRLDLAVDDKGEKTYFSLDTLRRCVKDKTITSRFRKVRDITETHIKTGKRTGDTLYFGSIQSDLQVRFYDKKSERKNNTGEEIEGEWVRTELQLRNDRAMMAAEFLASGWDVGRLVKGVLTNYIVFRRRPKGSKETNASRLPVAVFWEKFLEDVEKVQLTKERPAESIARKAKWIDQTVSASLALVAAAKLPEEDIDTRYIGTMIQEGMSRLDEGKIKTLNLYRKDIGLQPISLQEVQGRLIKMLKIMPV